MLARPKKSRADKASRGASRGPQVKIVPPVLRRRVQMEEDFQQIKSLQIKNDARWKDIIQFQEATRLQNLHAESRRAAGNVLATGPADTSAMFADVFTADQPTESVSTMRQPATQDPGDINSPMSSEEAAAQDSYRIRHRPESTANGATQGRMEWQNEFDRSIKRLFIDFDFTDAPAPRLRHLDRMHEWFTSQGQKQARKAKKGPSYITMERNVPPGKGSACWAPSGSKDGPDVLGGIYCTNRSRVRGVVPCPAGLSGRAN
mmetsp:Transcript_87180/g.244630  ORF Transcript_87180/g.244630 Transcript_87180/m.244630 type:complete len:261 (-) Transcript_87180:107-889(-)